MFAKLIRCAAVIAATFAVGAAQAANIGIGNHGWYTTTLANNLTAQGHTVTLYNSYNSATLAGLDAYIQDGNSFFNSGMLDTFVNNGGTLIELPWTFTHNSYTSGTRIMSSRTGLSYSQAIPGIVTVAAGNWLLNGVTLPGAGAHTIGREVGNTFDAGATQVLKWADGTAMLGFRNYGTGRVIGLNLHLTTSDASPLNAAWSNQIIYNAINGPAAAPNEVPEPTSLALFGLAAAALAMGRRRKA